MGMGTRLPPARAAVRHVWSSRGLSLIELAICMAIVATLTTISVALYADVTERSRIAKAIADIKAIETEINAFEFDNGRLPNHLGEINRATYKDPWGNPYEYLSFAAAGESAKGSARKDKSLVPINSTFDLYSKGKDGASSAALTSKTGSDDIIRANDGGYVGPASGY
jgi:general secretion pathway protein G